VELFLLLDCRQFAFTFYCFAVRACENGTRIEIRLKLGNGKQWELTAWDIGTGRERECKNHCQSALVESRVWRTISDEDEAGRRPTLTR